jgi:SAM-dependent methyltransferase
MRQPGETFDEVANLYHEVRPRYPKVLFDRIGEVAGLGEGAKVLEIGSGTGIATLPMLQRGWQVDCIEPGAALADVAKHHLSSYPNVSIRVGRFEDLPLPADGGTFDAIVSATAFHWVDRAVRYPRSHEFLRPGGHLAVIHYHHVAGGDVDLFEEIQDCYVAHMPGARRERLRPLGKRTQSASDMRKSGLFEIVESTSLVTVETYTTARYMELISTYSGHRMLEPDQLARLQTCIANVIDGAGGTINKAYAHELVIGRTIS